MVEPQPDAPPHVTTSNGATSITNANPEQDAVVSEMNGDGANEKKPAKDGAAPEDDSISSSNGVAPAATPTPTASATTPLPIQAALAQLVPKEVAQYAPLLVGKYYVQDKRAVWSGRWGMTEAAFGGNGVTSAFEMKSDEDVYIRTASGGADTVHPVFTGAALAKSSALETAAVDAVNPAYIGYEADASVRSALPFDCKYSGFFQIQAVKGKPQTVTEKSVEIRFVHDASRPSQFYVSGSGENRFGLFSLVGLLDKETSELRLYKIYKPKQPEKRAPPPKRTRAAAAASKPPAPAPKVQTKAAPLVNAPVVQVTPPANKAAIAPPPPAPVAAPSIPAAAPVLSVKRPLVTTPQGSEGSAASPFVVGRGQRKRVMPAHLRDENVLDHDQASPVLKKCHAILKGLMANPKAGPFLMPVDPIALGIPNYFDVIKEPMDLGTIRHNLEGGFYDDVSVFIDHVRLVFDNAMLYNAAHSQVHIFAAKLAEDFEKRIKNLNAKQAKERLLERSSSLLSTSASSIIKLKRERKGEPTHSTKKIKGGRGAKGNSKRAPADDTQLIMSLKEDIERLKATLEQLQPVVRVVTPKPSKAASRPFKMEDLTEEELNEPMTQADKARLSEDIRQLPQEKINRVLQIIAESVPVSKLTNENDEVEIDINSFDTRCLRMLEGYVRENGIGRKRKRPTLTKKAGKSAPVSHRLKSAKVAAVNIRQRQEQLKNQLAMIDGNGQVVAAVPSAAVAPDVEMAKPDDSSSDSSSSSSDSSDSDSDSDSESDSDGAAPLQRSPVLSGGASLSQLSDSARADAAKKIRDEMSSREPLKVENRGAWSLLAQKDATSDQSLLPAEENPTSSLWMSARSMEQVKQQKIQQKEKERSDELEAQRRRDAEQREKDKEREREEAERRKQEQEASHREAHEERVRQERAREAERARAAHRAVEREKLLQDEDLDEHHEHTLTEDLESFSSSSFL